MCIVLTFNEQFWYTHSAIDGNFEHCPIQANIMFDALIIWHNWKHCATN